MKKARVIRAEFLYDGSGKKYMEFAGTSELEKPVNDLIAMGSLYHEVDTTRVYAYNEYAESGEEWVYQLAFTEDSGVDLPIPDPFVGN